MLSAKGPSTMHRQGASFLSLSSAGYLFSPTDLPSVRAECTSCHPLTGGGFSKFADRGTFAYGFSPFVLTNMTRANISRLFRSVVNLCLENASALENKIDEPRAVENLPNCARAWDLIEFAEKHFYRMLNTLAVHLCSLKYFATFLIKLFSFSFFFISREIFNFNLLSNFDSKIMGSNNRKLIMSMMGNLTQLFSNMLIMLILLYT